MRTARILALGVVLVPSLALAQEATPQSDPLHSPGFVQMDRYDQNSRVGAELSYLLYDDDVIDATGLRFDFHGHYVDKGSGFGGYAQVPIGYISGDDDSATQVGNLDVGGLFTKQVANLVGIVGRVGLVLPTASDDGEKALAGAVTSYSRITDIVEVYPKATALRLSFSPIIRTGQIFVRGDIGVDVILDTAGPNDDADNLIRFGAGVGYDGGSFAIGGDLVLVDAEDSATNLSLFGRFAAGPATPYVALIFPLSDEISDLMTLAFTAGLDVKL